MRIRLVVALALTFALSACGVGSDSAEKPSKGASTSRAKQALDASLPQVSDGTPVPAALSGFECTRDDKGTWRASGAVTNDTKKSRTFQVTVHVGPADGEGAAARTKRIAAVQTHGSVRFDLGTIESRSPDGPCHVQVLAVG
jgi:hypothetical protein